MAALNPACKNPLKCYQICKNGAFPCGNPNVRLYTPTAGKCPAASGNHTLVRDAALKGLTGIRILKYPNKAAPMARSGWYLECYEIQALHLGYDVTEASNRINKISI